MLESFNRPHISYSSFDDGYIKYARQLKDGSWDPSCRTTRGAYYDFYCGGPGMVSIDLETDQQARIAFRRRP